jgi:hypothetical protein
MSSWPGQVQFCLYCNLLVTSEVESRLCYVWNQPCTLRERERELNEIKEYNVILALLPPRDKFQAGLLLITVLSGICDLVLRM